MPYCICCRLFGGLRSAQGSPDSRTAYPPTGGCLRILRGGVMHLVRRLAVAAGSLLALLLAGGAHFKI